MSKKKNEEIIKVKVILDEIAQKYASRISADALSNSLKESIYAYCRCYEDANKPLQRTAKRRC